MLNVRFAIGYTIGQSSMGPMRCTVKRAVAFHEAKGSGRRVIEYDQTTRIQNGDRGR